jgi:Zn-dependent protease
MDDCIIAWAGVVAQAIVAVPIIVVVSIFGNTRVEPLNAALAIWGFFSFGTAIFNLLPVPPLDGARAWRIVPLAIGRVFRRISST